MTKQDIVICAGDFGGIWFGDARDDEELDWLESLPFTLTFVDGNHENYDALERYPIEIWRGGKVHRVRPHVLHLMRGQIFGLDGYRFFTMGSAKSHDIARRVDHVSWWEQELPSDEEYAETERNLERCGWKVDYIISYCAPTIIARMASRHNEADRLTEFLQTVMEKTRYHYWLFGHYHDNRIIEEKHILLWEQIVQVI